MDFIALLYALPTVDVISCFSNYFKKMLPLTLQLSIPDFVHELIDRAYRTGASDIHIDPGKDTISIRLRVDGIVQNCDEYEKVPISMLAELVARVKVLAGLRTDVHMTPHDGRFCVERSGMAGGHSGYSCDVRVSILPTQFGENIVLRLLPKTGRNDSLETLGFSPEHIALIREAVARPQGMILVTGPTGAGKTSTQYGLVSETDPESQVVITLEDPIEYALPGVRQVAIREKHGLTFPAGLRSILRQDPDVIMVGEMRDTETARIAVNAALTGHLLISTLHTNTALDTIPRLIDMGIEPYLIASTLTLIIGQRLARRVCEGCRGRGESVTGACGICFGKSYRGRLVISEVIPMDEKMRSYILRRIGRDDLEKYVRSLGIPSLREDGFVKAEKGMTTMEEVLRVI